MAKIEFESNGSDGKVRIDGKEAKNCSEFSLRCLPGNIPVATLHLVMERGEDSGQATVEGALVEYMVRELTADGGLREYIAVEQPGGDWLVHVVK